MMVNPETIETEPVEAETTAEREAPMAIPIGPMSVLEDLVGQIAELIRNAKRMPLSSSALIERKQVLDLIETLRRSIPEEVARARAVIRDRDGILERAQHEAAQFVERAKRERERLVEKTEIVQQAARRAEIMLAEAEAAARRLRQDAEEYAEAKLANFEVVLQKTLAAVERGRARLATRIEEEQLGPADPEEDIEV